MNCEDLDMVIFDYTDGLISATTREAVDAHILGCPGCRQAVAQARRLETTLATRSARPALSNTFARRLHERLAARARLEAEFQEGLQRLRKNYFSVGALAEHAGYAVAATIAAWLLWRVCAGTGNLTHSLLAFGSFSLALGAVAAFPSIRRSVGV
jgi:anti-sigma factor RsiW